MSPMIFFGAVAALVTFTMFLLLVMTRENMTSAHLTALGILGSVLAVDILAVLIWARTKLRANLKVFSEEGE